LKKIILWTSVVIALLAVAVLLGGEKVAFSYLSPPKYFEQSETPSPPDYTNKDFWVSLPNKADTADLIPPNIDLSKDLDDRPVDVFFIHSTGYFGPGGWNSTMSVENSEAQSIEYMLSSMASAFNGCCRIYAPHYREAHIASFFPSDNKARFAAFDLAYQDVEASFEYFLSHYNKGRPFIIVSHSQGTLHAQRLMATKIDSTPLLQKMIVAYTLGYWFPMDMFERNFEHIRPCGSAHDTQCVVSYDTYAEGSQQEGIRPHWYGSGWEMSQGKQTLCVNPLSWRMDTEQIDKDEHFGGLPVEFKRQALDILLARNPGYVYQELANIEALNSGAKCTDEGLLIVNKQENNAFSNHGGNENGSYHVFDFSLFYANIRANAIDRVNVYFRNQERYYD
jgi:pimeloyl-ACP methyl ester carboxylesterase